LKLVDARSLAAAAVHQHYAIQQEEELAQAIEMAQWLDPKVIVEIGCDAGGTLWAWKQVARTVYGVTLPVSPPGQGLFPQGVHPLETHGARVWLGDSHDAAARHWLNAQLAGRPVDFLFIDGDHTVEGVMADYRTYGHLVRPGGIIALDDVANPDLDVHVAWERITAALPACNHLTIKAGDMPAGIGLIRAGT
jgi:cephalosporin hydroxylase